MGEVIVYLASDLHPKEHVVLQPDFDSCEFELKAAQSELAALREELERQKHYVEINANSAHGKHKEGQQYKDERDALREDLAAIIANRNDLKQRLTAAEQRNVELVDLLRTHTDHIATLCDVMFRFGLGMYKEPEQKIYSALVQQQVVFAALKPIESGASE